MVQVLDTWQTPVVTALPVTPANGDQIIYTFTPTVVSGSAEVNRWWHLIYNTATAYWYPVGAIPLLAEIPADEYVGSTTYTTLATAGPAVTVPLLGDYIVEIGCRMTPGIVVGTNLMSYQNAAIAASDSDALLERVIDANSANARNEGGGSRAVRKTAVAAGASLSARYRSTAGTCGWAERWMKVTPVRVR